MRALLLICVLALLVGYIPASAEAAPRTFALTAEERAYLDGLRGQPLEIAYSYDLLNIELDGRQTGMLMPLVGVLRDEFGLEVNLRKLSWEDAFARVESGETDYYGPIALSDARRQKYITAGPFYRSYSEIVSRVSDPIDSMRGLYNHKAGLLTGSIITRTMQTYLGPEGEIVYFSTMDDMIEGLRLGLIDAFATVDNAELEILRNTDIRYEFSVENFHADQGFISSREELRPLSRLLDRYIEENPGIVDEIAAVRRDTIFGGERERLSKEIAYLKSNYDEVLMYADASRYPLCYLENGSIKGLQTEINGIFEELTGVGVRLGTQNEFPDQIASAVQKLKTGECMALAGAYYDMDTANDPALQYSPIVWADTVRTYSYGDIGGDLLGRTVGTTPFASDYVGWNIVTGKLPVIYNSNKEMMDAMRRGDVDVVFAGEMAFNYRYTVLKDYGLREVADISAEAAVHILYGARNPQFNTLFDEAITLLQVLDPKSMGIWKLQTERYKSDYIRMRNNQQIWIAAVIVVFAVMTVALYYLLRRNKQAFEDIEGLLKKISAPICVVEAETGTILDINEAFSEMCGLVAGDGLMKPSIRTLIKLDGAADIVEKLRVDRNFECVINRPDGSAIEAEMFAHPLIFQSRKTFAVHCINLTKLKMEKQMLNDAIAEAEEKRRTILDSIDYASRIQKNLLPADSTFRKAFSDHSVIWKPKDIVGGDIYWLKTFEKGSVLCVCDCTGHGTPGALLTMLAVSSFESVVSEANCDDTAEIMFRLDQRISSVLNAGASNRPDRRNSVLDLNDGCDLAVLFVSRDGRAAISAGNMHVFICDGREVTQIKGQKLHIGEGSLNGPEDVGVTVVPPAADNKFYIASDGLYDQIGGEFERPFGYKEVKDIILQNHNEKQEKISQKIWEAFENYRGGQQRRDDAQLITFKI